MKDVFAMYRDFDSCYSRKALYLSRRVKLYGTNQISYFLRFLFLPHRYFL